MNYPEHEKLQAVVKESQTCGEFIDWLAEAHGAHLMVYERREEEWFPLSVGIRKLLAEFFDIDQDRLEDEKRLMLEGQRALNLRQEMRDAAGT